MHPAYVVITPARNEASHIEATLRAVVGQSVRPLKWVIVSDGSTDGTDDIVKCYLPANPWIALVRMPERKERHFAGKVMAFNAGYEQVSGLDYDVICSLDADISFGEHYFSFLLSKLLEDRDLGLVGTPFEDGASREVYDYRYVSVEHVSGACQVFRRACFEAIGGYHAVKGGGIDYIAVVSARMNGWKTRTFTEMTCIHARQIGSAQSGWLASRFRVGVKDYNCGNHLLWELFRTMHQMRKRPMVVGGLLICCGYGWAAIRRVRRPVSDEFVAFCGQEQMRRLREFLTRRPHLV